MTTYYAAVVRDQGVVWGSGTSRTATARDAVKWGCSEPVDILPCSRLVVDIVDTYGGGGQEVKDLLDFTGKRLTVKPQYRQQVLIDLDEVLQRD
jgi:hypothetical protein